MPKSAKALVSHIQFYCEIHFWVYSICSACVRNWNSSNSTSKVEWEWQKAVSSWFGGCGWDVSKFSFTDSWFANALILPISTSGCSSDFFWTTLKWTKAVKVSQKAYMNDLTPHHECYNWLLSSTLLPTFSLALRVNNCIAISPTLILIKSQKLVWVSANYLSS